MHQCETISFQQNSSKESPDPDPLPSGESLLSSQQPYYLNLNLFKLNSGLVKDDIAINSDTLLFKELFFPNVINQDWNNWHWQIKNSITDYNRLEEIFGVEINKTELINNKLPFRITPYYASVVYAHKVLCKAVIPSTSELVLSKGESIDPLGEDHDRPVHCIVHRYPDRVLFLVTNFCSTNCRYCTRSRIVSNKNFIKTQMKEWEAAFEYIRKNPSIRDVVVSGGDPLTLPDFSIEYLLKNLYSIPHIEMVRIGTKVPVVLPMRITKQLLRIFKKFKPLYMSIHFTHPKELTPEVNFVCNQIADSGVVMGSQSVLLKDINDDPAVMKDLMHGLLKIRIRPYYIYQCDPIMGSNHFRTTVEKGLEIIENLRGWTSGYGVPHYVIDAPNGGGKIPLLPDYYQGIDEEGNVKLRNYERNNYLYYNS